MPPSILLPYKPGEVTVKASDLVGWVVSPTKGTPEHVSGPCPYCHYADTYLLPSDTVLGIDAVEPHIDYDPARDETRPLKCKCPEDHPGRPAKTSTGCGATWQITLVRAEDGRWTVNPGDPHMASAATALAADAAADEVKIVRAAAEKWIAGVAAIYGLFSLAAALIAKSTVATLPTAPKVLVVTLAVLALCGAVLSILASYSAAYSWPVLVNVETDAGLQRWFAQRQQRLPQAVKLLHQAIGCAIGSLVALALAFGIVWLWPPVFPSLVSVTYSQNGNPASEASMCGQLTSVSATELKLTILSGPNAGTATVPVAWLVTTAPASSC